MKPRIFPAALVTGLVLSAAAGAAPPRPEASPLEAALHALETSDYATSSRKLEEARSLAKDPAEVQLGQARLYLATGRYAEAAVAASRASGARASRARALAVQAEALSRTGRVADAIALVQPLQGALDAPRANLVLGSLYLREGQRARAEAPLLSIIEAYNQGRVAKTDAEGLAMVGRAADLLRSPRDANDAYNQAERAGAHRVETLLWRAELFLDRYDPGHAEEVIREALAAAPENAEAHVLLARLRLDQSLDFVGAAAELDKALATNPVLAEAYFVRAQMALRAMDIRRADAAVTRGLATDPTNLELLSMRAAARFLDDDARGFEAARREVLGRNPEYARFFAIVGEIAEWEHRYDEIVSLMEDATRVDPDEPKAWAELGLNAIRAGDEANGLLALRRAWKGDHFNVRVFNTLNLFERDIPAEYETVDAPPFRLRVPKGERAILERYVPAMLQRAFSTFTRRYGFEVPGPIGVELYQNREHFSVRTSGLPNAGIQGVCFGRTLAATSPRGEPANWGNVLWHELAHVFALERSKSRVPRWFTEGLSEFETIRERPEWRREEDPPLYLALRGGRIPSLVNFNEAFLRVDDPRDIGTAYYAASQVLVFLDERFGTARVVSMLGLWGRGKKTAAVLEEALGVSATALDAALRAWLAQRLSRYDAQFVPDDHAPPLARARAAAAASLGDPRAQFEAAVALLREKKADLAMQAIEATLRLDPSFPDALYVRSRVRAGTGDRSAAREDLLTLVRQGSDGYAVRMALAELALARGDAAGAEHDLGLARTFDPTMAEAANVLYQLLHKAGRDAEALPVLRDLAALEQHDRKVHGALLAALVEQKAYADAQAEGEVALFVDLENPTVHSLFAKALSETGEHARAAYELESALVLEPPDAEKAALHASLASERLALGDKVKARSERDEALRLDRDNAQAKGLRIP